MEHLTEEERANMFTYFDFDNHWVNLFRTGSFYARLDFNKFSNSKVRADYVNAAEGLAHFHRGNETHVHTGLIENETLQTVSYEDHVAALLAAPIGPIEELALPTFLDG